ncbi:hypothetical protein JCM4814A_40900 [Streptomyces phaeofaciens JCM 4814]|uniref:Uncharacterized protein n=1 Tax=Streptomyces phaeofaciens TaxID=68254 RepID=A0A918LZP4_9ACTN|nr:hypothetical protein [Streptomyces phaeofaciens]GGT80622.1 hypothetical protein GCM10010226_68950 [Streptomyces phaeofaciens]
MSDRVTEAYVRESASPGSRLPMLLGEARLPPVLTAAYGTRFLPRPLFVQDDHMTRFAEDLVQFYDLITALPRRMFDGDLHRYCAALGIGERKKQLVTRLGGGTPPLYGRADLSYDGRRFQLLEFNVTSEIGGVERGGEIPRVMAEAGCFAPFAAEHDLRYVDTGHRVAETLKTLAGTVSRTGTAVVAVLEAPGGLAENGPGWQAVAAVLRRHGLDCLVGEVQQIRRRGDHLVLDGRTVDVVLRGFTIEELLAQSDGEILAEPLFRAHEAGTAVLWTPMESGLIDNKGCLAMLCAPWVRAGLSAEELALIDRVLPWTRALRQNLAAVDSALLDQCMAHRTELILKPNAEYGGEGVVAGWEVSEREWHRALASVGPEGAVAQRRAVPRPESVVDPFTGRAQDWRAVWGLFLTPEGPAGMEARAVPDSGGAVVGLRTNARACIAGVFTFPGNTPPESTAAVRP